MGGSTIGGRDRAMGALMPVLATPEPRLGLVRAVLRSLIANVGASATQEAYRAVVAARSQALPGGPPAPTWEQAMAPDNGE